MINDENIMDLSDYADRDIKEEFAHIVDSITSLEKLIDAKESNSENSDSAIPKYLKATIRENLEELSLPIEEKCDALEQKINTLSDTINQVNLKQQNNGKLLLTTTILAGVVLVLSICSLFLLWM
ncbi:MAG: hypothetical protein IJR96_04315 [Pseudobutyrivibrio sp.]|nr:hypothetical protein [Pseudobutyrivibrio sp.]